MHASIASLAAAGLVGVCLSGHAADVPYTADSVLDRPGLAVDEDNLLRPTGAASKPGRAADAEVTLKSAGASHKAGRMADEDLALKSAGASSKPGRAADDEVALKSAGASHAQRRIADEDQSLKSAGTSSRPGRMADTDKALKAPGASGPGGPRRRSSRPGPRRGRCAQRKAACSNRLRWPSPGGEQLRQRLAGPQLVELFLRVR